MLLISLGVTLKHKYFLFLLVFIFLAYGFPVNNALPKEPKFEYKNKKEFIESLNICANYHDNNININLQIPRKILLSQAILESNYGTSRFAKEGNNLFGIMTFNLNEPHLKPYNDTSKKFGAKVYETKCKSVKDYINVLNNGSSFKDFRKLRQSMIENKNFDELYLVTTLNKYATNPDYIHLLQKTIKSLNKNY